MKIRIMAIKTLTPEFMSGSNRPSPANVSGPTNNTIRPPPIMIKIHIANMKENIGRDIRVKLPS